MTNKIDEKFKKYGESKEGNFRIIDSIGVPHPYCITPNHLKYNQDRMYLGNNEIKEMEEKFPNKVRCDICKGKLSFDEHKQALLMECRQEIKENKEFHAYLLSIKELAIKDNYEGFAFLKKF